MVDGLICKYFLDFTKVILFLKGFFNSSQSFKKKYFPNLVNSTTTPFIAKHQNEIINNECESTICCRNTRSVSDKRTAKISALTIEI